MSNLITSRPVLNEFQVVYMREVGFQPFCRSQRLEQLKDKHTLMFTNTFIMERVKKALFPRQQ